MTFHAQAFYRHPEPSEFLEPPALNDHEAHGLQKRPTFAKRYTCQGVIKAQTNFCLPQEFIVRKSAVDLRQSRKFVRKDKMLDKREMHPSATAPQHLFACSCARPCFALSSDQLRRPLSAPSPCSASPFASFSFLPAADETIIGTYVCVKHMFENLFVFYFMHVLSPRRLRSAFLLSLTCKV